MTAAEWLERDYDVVFAVGQSVTDPVSALLGLKVTSYAADPTEDRPGPLFSVKPDGFGYEPVWPEAAWWPAPHEGDNLDLPGEL